MSCPDGKAKQTCAEHGASGVARPAFPEKEDFIRRELGKPGNRKGDAWALRRAERAFLKAVQDAVIDGELNEEEAARRTNPAFAAECVRMAELIRLDDREAERLITRLRETGKTIDLDAFIWAITDLDRNHLSGQGVGDPRGTRLVSALVAYLGQAWQEGKIPYSKFEELARPYYARHYADAHFEAVAHTMTLEDFRRYVRPAWRKRAERYLREDHARWVRDALRAGKTVPPKVLADYPHIQDAASQPKGKLFPQELEMLARRVLSFDSLEEYRLAIADRLAGDYEEYVRLYKAVIQPGCSQAEEQRFAEYAQKISAVIRWAYGFDEAAIRSGVLPKGCGIKVSKLWRKGGGEDFSRLHFGNAENARLSSGLLLPADREQFAANISDAIPGYVRELLFDSAGRTRPITSIQAGTMEQEAVRDDMLLDHDGVEELLRWGKAVPPDAVVRFPDLVAKYGL